MNDLPVAALEALRCFDLNGEFVLEEDFLQGQSNATWLFKANAGDFILKRHSGYVDLDHILAEHHLLGWLADQRLPFVTPLPILTKTGGTLAIADQGWFSIQPWIRGTRVDVQDPRQVAAFGTALGEILGALERYQPSRHVKRSLRNVMFPIELKATLWHGLVNEACRPLPFATDPYEWFAAEYEAVELLLAPQRSGLRTQVTHGDYVPSNVLWADGAISGMLDFECASLQYTALDCAMALLFTVRYWTNQDSEATISAFGEGFRSTNVLLDAEMRALPGLMRLQLVASTAWWMALAYRRRLPATDLCSRLERARDHVDWIRENGDLIQAGMQG